MRTAVLSLSRCLSGWDDECTNRTACFTLFLIIYFSLHLSLHLSLYHHLPSDPRRYSWVKPAVPQKAITVLEYIPLEEEVYFKFPGERGDGVGIIKRLRFDDQTGEDCYDVQHKNKTEVYIKWVSRMRIKTIPKGHDELVLQRMERQWRNILRRTDHALAV